MKPLKVGLVVDGPLSDKYTFELARWAADQPDIEISHLVVQASPQKPTRESKPTLNDRLSEVCFRLITFFERLLLQFERPYANHYQRSDLRAIVGGVVENVEAIKSLGLDLLIQCGSKSLPDAMLRASRLGAVRIGQGDSQRLPGTASGFLECYRALPQTAFTICRVADGSRADEVLVSGSFWTRYYFSLNQAQLCVKAYSHLRNLLKHVASTGQLPDPPGSSHRQNRHEGRPDVHVGVSSRLPRASQSVAYAATLAGRILTKTLRRILGIKERWGISFVRGSWSEIAAAQRIEASLPKGRYWADPFVWSRAEGTFCFVEDFVYKTNRAHITALELTGTKVVEHGIALEEPFHLSFPFLFQYQGDLYMCPETAESGQIRLYRCAEFPLRWVLHHVVMDRVSAVDTMFFEREGKWWMLTNIDQAGTGEYGSELYVFSANSPLDTAWTPHPRNPVKIDSRGGRNAGLIVDGGRLFRVGQVQGFDQYGEGMRIYEIKDVTDSTFREELVAEIRPAFEKRQVGTHHLSTDGKTTVVDQMSYSRSFLVNL